MTDPTQKKSFGDLKKLTSETYPKAAGANEELKADEVDSDYDFDFEDE